MTIQQWRVLPWFEVKDRKKNCLGDQWIILWPRFVVFHAYITSIVQVLSFVIFFILLELVHKLSCHYFAFLTLFVWINLQNASCQRGILTLVAREKKVNFYYLSTSNSPLNFTCITAPLVNSSFSLQKTVT